MELFKIFFHPATIRRKMKQNQQPKRVSLESFHFIIADKDELEDLKLSKNESIKI
ncbi:MAG: hypothetical protein CM1200mP28_15870 [Deltaproteobacteria bacterium]|nr:MAG: hypothetical protein CM1200mP28_15870 [Deltaproteobacteria bacterium]